MYVCVLIDHNLHSQHTGHESPLEQGMRMAYTYTYEYTCIYKYRCICYIYVRVCVCVYVSTYTPSTLATKRHRRREGAYYIHNKYKSIHK